MDRAPEERQRVHPTRLGVDHFGIVVPDVRTTMQQMDAAGYTMIQSGLGTGAQGDGGYDYYETEGQIAATIELIELPKERVAQMTIYPPDAG